MTTLTVDEIILKTGTSADASKTTGKTLGSVGFWTDTGSIMVGNGAGNARIEFIPKSAVESLINAAFVGVATGMTPKGNYNAETNTPALPVAGASNNGWVYKVTVSRTTQTAIANTSLLDVQAGDLVWSDGTAWAKIDNTEITYAAATTAADGLMSAADKTKLNGVAAGANNYSHPANHPASIITQDATNRFVTDAEKTAWNAKASTTVATTSAAGLMAAADKTKLDGVATGATNTPLATAAPLAGNATAALGTSTKAAKEDHRHAHPTKADVGLGSVENLSAAQIIATITSIGGGTY